MTQTPSDLSSIPLDSEKSQSSFVKEGVLDAIKIGAGETYLSAFAIYLGALPLQIGLLSTLPVLLGAIAQSIGVWIVERIQSRREVTRRLIFIQGGIWIPLALLPVLFAFNILSSAQSVLLLLVLVSLFQLTVGALSPLWSSLVGDTLSPQKRGTFFGRRNRWIAITTFIALCAAGEVIHLCKHIELEYVGFTAVFLVAAVARIYAGRVFKGVDDPPFHIADETKFTFWQFIARAKFSNFARFVFFVTSMNFAVAIGGPYFAVYMLKGLQLTYLEYTAVVGTAVLGQFLVMGSWGSLSDQFGNQKILRVCGWLVAINPFLWLVTHEFWWILFVQLYSGIFWSGFNLAAANFLFDAVSAPKRARCVAYQAIVNGLMVCFGSVIGGLVVTYYPDSFPKRFGLFIPESIYALLFLISGLFRLAIVYKLLPTFKEVRAVRAIGNKELLIRVISLRPLSGFTFSFLPGISRKKVASAPKIVKESVDEEGPVS